MNIREILEEFGGKLLEANKRYNKRLMSRDICLEYSNKLLSHAEKQIQDYINEKYISKDETISIIKKILVKNKS